MIRLIAASALCLAMLSGCATTQKIVNKVSGSETPLAQVLSERADLRKDLATVEIRQYFNRAENPTAAEVKVTETGLMDDSVKSIRTVYSFKKSDDHWTLVGTEKAYQCYRGKNTNTFQTGNCA